MKINYKRVAWSGHYPAISKSLGDYSPNQLIKAFGKPSSPDMYENYAWIFQDDLNGLVFKIHDRKVGERDPRHKEFNSTKNGSMIRPWVIGVSSFKNRENKLKFSDASDFLKWFNDKMGLVS